MRGVELRRKPLSLQAVTSAPRRFSGIAQLYGEKGFHRIRTAQVAIIGVGGVGSWAVEALARSGVGRLRLIDLDHVGESNINRQIHALESSLGMAKVQAMKARIGDINPECEVSCVEQFVCADSPLEFIPDDTDVVIDAIDHAYTKAALIAALKRAKTPLITCGGAGGKLDPTRICLGDLSRTEQDSLLAKTRKTLRQRHGFTHNPRRRFGVTAVYSPQAPQPVSNPADNPNEASLSSPARLSCTGYGSVMTVTAGFGLTAAAWVLKRLAQTTPPTKPNGA